MSTGKGLSPKLSRAQELTNEFLSVAHDFMLGDLVTESFHPKSVGLSETAKLNLKEAISQFVKIDQEMLEALLEKAPELEELYLELQDVLNRNEGRIFLCGCGATGRLSLTLEFLWKTQNPKQADRVIAFMAGGDAALVSSIEKFEDYPDYGKRQLEDLGFSKKDLLLAVTEGGETPWVIGACERASEISERSPYFLYCNPDEVLANIERSKNVIENPKIKKINLTHCPQALSGSTRLQASTIQMAAIGFCLFPSEVKLSERIRYLKDWYLNLDHQKLDFFTKEEARLYERGEVVHYLPDEKLSISVFTDTTERTPTFSLAPFESTKDQGEASKCFIILKNFADSMGAWKSLLAREPRGIDWEETVEKTGKERLLTYDFSRNAFLGRKKRTSKEAHNFSIRKEGNLLAFDLSNHQVFFDLPKEDHLLCSHLILKMLLNMHSTLLMGRLGRFESNVMTWVRPTNNKLIDRTVRYAGMLLRQSGFEVEYDRLVRECFEVMEDASKEAESVVLEIVKRVRTQ